MRQSHKKRQAPQPTPNRRIEGTTAFLFILSNCGPSPSIKCTKLGINHYPFLLNFAVRIVFGASTTANAWETECSRVPSPASPSPATTVSPTPASVTDDQCPHCRVRCSPCWSRPRRMANELAAWKWCGEESLRSSIPPLKGRRPSGPRLPSADPLGLQAQDAPVIRTVCRSLLFSSGLQVVEALEWLIWPLKALH